MMTYVVGFGGIAIVAWTIVLLDYLGQRQQQKARKTLGRCGSSPHAADFWP